MFEITQRVTVKDGDVEFELPVGRIRDTDARRYGLLTGDLTSAELTAAAHAADAAPDEVPAPEAPAEAPKKGKK